MRKMEAALLGATGIVGQQFAALLAEHPWFTLTRLAASERSAGRRYGDLPWRLATAPHPSIADLPVSHVQPGAGPRLVFSALDASVAGEVELAYARAGHVVVSNARNHRMDPLVPLLVPEINHGHLALLPRQQQTRRWPGAILTNPNCSTVFLALALAALRAFEPDRVLVSTLQALSGAGHPGVASLDAMGNVIPFIPGEEEKIETETKKILGRLVPVCRGGSSDPPAIEPHPVAISAQTTRVPVAHGHTELVSVGFRRRPEPADVLAALRDFSARPQHLRLPSAPAGPIVPLPESDRPQPRLDVERHGGMAVLLGRLRPCPVLDYKFVLLGHNTIRGAAGAALLNAELLLAEGLLN
jgi:aspartate-semialdehyde dehydrogenase